MVRAPDVRGTVVHHLQILISVVDVARARHLRDVPTERCG